ncbi:hypothetical protein IQ279_12250 [Streptomyces verrucosisporus]|uniref:hypothetical protein n=1 Tax=Streptomyces verrucosisporus TaxID=1695161 RepID=UPI0019CFB740|nr:hypothetical protein [Streptomyces verrucosisporus]MBN3930396.1 hypothetical protein [Streptomyces verrucosisporus]
MENKGLGFLVGLVVAGTLGWALAETVYLGCGPSIRGCAVPDGGGWHFAAMMTVPWLLTFFGNAVIRDDDWRPSLGITAGAAAGIAFALSKDAMPPRMWILVTVLAVIAIGAPLTLWCRGRSRQIS